MVCQSSRFLVACAALASIERVAFFLQACSAASGCLRKVEKLVSQVLGAISEQENNAGKDARR